MPVLIIAIILLAIGFWIILNRISSNQTTSAARQLEAELLWLCRGNEKNTQS